MNEKTLNLRSSAMLPLIEYEHVSCRRSSKAEVHEIDANGHPEPAEEIACISAVGDETPRHCLQHNSKY